MFKKWQSHFHATARYPLSNLLFYLLFVVNLIEQAAILKVLVVSNIPTAKIVNRNQIDVQVEYICKLSKYLFV